jgi:NAD-dependent DNA ligase
MQTKELRWGYINNEIGETRDSLPYDIDGVVYNYQLLIDGSHCGGGGFIYFNKP